MYDKFTEWEKLKEKWKYSVVKLYYYIWSYTISFEVTFKLNLYNKVLKYYWKTCVCQEGEKMES